MVKQIAAAVVICNKEKHKIILTKRGQLVFCNHSSAELKAEGLSDMLAKTSCRCYDVYKAWQARGENGIVQHEDFLNVPQEFRALRYYQRKYPQYYRMAKRIIKNKQVFVDPKEVTILPDKDKAHKLVANILTNKLTKFGCKCEAIEAETYYKLQIYGKEKKKKKLTSHVGVIVGSVDNDKLVIEFSSPKSKKLLTVKVTNSANDISKRLNEAILFIVVGLQIDEQKRIKSLMPSFASDENQYAHDLNESTKMFKVMTVYGDKFHINTSFSKLNKPTVTVIMKKLRSIEGSIERLLEYMNRDKSAK